MRVRHKPWARELIRQHPEWVIEAPGEKSGKWNSVFGNNHPIHVEVGTGKGQFLIEMARTHPDVNYIGIEMFSDVLVMALQKLLETPLPNLRFIRSDGREISQYFDSNEVDQIYLNFSDPWPKKRHAKRRLTHGTFLSQYEKVLSPKGKVAFKTDNQKLFEYSLCSLSSYGMILDFVSLDLHHSDFSENIMTEYEEKFSSKGHRIYRLEAHFDNEKISTP